MDDSEQYGRLVRRRLESGDKALEFAVFSMCVTTRGYVLRSTSAIKSVKRLAREDALGTAVGHDQNAGLALGVLTQSERAANSRSPSYCVETLRKHIPAEEGINRALSALTRPPVLGSVNLGQG
ncbi:hypothetical protein EDB86DRAFT_2826702 [Lactarius hatsudake]|nr:hypothetical protein EDB86DRAFT_2826702 [Lactarius hatsudake]